MTAMTTGRALVVSLLLVVGVGACSDDEEPTAVCGARDDLSAAITALGDVDALTEGRDAVDAAVDDLQSALDEVGEATSDDVEDEVDAAQAALDDVIDTVGSLGDESSPGEALEAVSDSLSTFATAVAAVVGELDEDCD
jgi:cytochrome c556